MVHVYAISLRLSGHQRLMVKTIVPPLRTFPPRSREPRLYGTRVRNLAAPFWASKAHGQNYSTATADFSATIARASTLWYMCAQSRHAGCLRHKSIHDMRRSGHAQGGQISFLELRTFPPRSREPRLYGTCVHNLATPAACGTRAYMTCAEVDTRRVARSVFWNIGGTKVFDHSVRYGDTVTKKKYDKTKKLREDGDKRR